MKLRPANAASRKQPFTLGHTNAGPSRRVVLQIADARRHLHILGPTGQGKSTLLLHLALDAIHAGRGIAVIEPRGDLIRDILDRMPTEAGDRLVLIDPDETQAPPALNVLEGTDGDHVVEQLTSTLRRLWHASWGQRIEDTLRHAALTLVRRPGSTLADIPSLLTNDRFRAEATTGLSPHDPIHGFWEAYNRLSLNAQAASCGPVLSKLRAITSRPFAAALFGTARSTFRPADILDGGVLLARLPKGQLGEDGSALVGSLLVSQLWQATLARINRQETARPDATVMIDEAQNYLHLPTPLDDALAESRGYRTGWILAHQHLDQLTPSLRKALSANAKNKLYFGLSIEDAKDLAAHVGPYLDATDLANLDKYHAACRLTVDGKDTTGFTLQTLPAPPAIPGRANAMRQAARRHGLPRSERQHTTRRRRAIPSAPISPPISEL
ncbi:hypothetical protein D5S17_14585 [Pseudonocardiaceae bacterium YIM PH 21723]|nr:hypothetical protein D5S17_14585 [Pseudonocardiaceae bacterium YIM PH 21723]